ncbi:hypothetical protein SPRG_10494 [Saprolegnia parasitica CBS 223.65]|uniref:BART domain-containing protein n=1 Tax=Saprolegnia parasitica (strain CBS 223.65) TaxID=695850 RepID=A0A067CB31_SAPPC|nr:hypothetical protein SPRG_10494 [Saprolegnia parasitica CBS 223.65]KDO23716.1 hypothetical protein SPRG_10494 [Saprolegnia parasitica CBS 223.65]|eukprot:XP_012205534.1 hypothetical protein SPRG_10494 [Saprolegnia parasitica CBS 223.65]
MNNFQRLLDSAREDVARGTKPVARRPRTPDVIEKVLMYLLELDEDGFGDLFAFEQRVIPFFEGSATEYRLECTQAHDEFQALVETKLERFLTKEGWTPTEFYDHLRAELSTMDSLRSEHEHAEDLVRMIHDAFDFDSWAQSMRWSANGLARFDRK